MQVTKPSWLRSQSRSTPRAHHAQTINIVSFVPCFSTLIGPISHGAVRPTFPFPFPLSFLESAINFDDATVRCSSTCSWSSAQPTEHHIFDVIPFCSFLEYKKPPPLSISSEYTIRRLESRKRRPLLKMRALVLLYAMHST